LNVIEYNFVMSNLNGLLIFCLYFIDFDGKLFIVLFIDIFKSYSQKVLVVHKTALYIKTLSISSELSKNILVLFNSLQYHINITNIIHFKSNYVGINLVVFLHLILIRHNYKGAAVEVPHLCRGFFICQPNERHFHNNFFRGGRPLGEENLLINDPTLPPELLVNNIRFQTGPFFFYLYCFH